MDDIEFYKFLERSEKTGLLFQTAASKFGSNHIQFSDSSGNILIPEIITKQEWINPNAGSGERLKLTVDDSQKQEDVDEYWLNRLQQRIDKNDNSDIFDGTVLQTLDITETELQTNLTTFFTVASHREAYTQTIAESVLDEELVQQQDRSVSDITSMYSLIGATYTVILDSPNHTARYVLLGKRNKNMNTLSGYFACCPAGILEKHHAQTEKHDILQTLRNHFEEELNEEVYQHTLDEEELATDLQEYSDMKLQGIGIDPLRFATELAVTVTITGELATKLLDTSQYQQNEEFEYISPIRLQDLTLEKNLPYQLTPQSAFSLGLLLTKEGLADQTVFE